MNHFHEGMKFVNVSNGFNKTDITIEINVIEVNDIRTTVFSQLSY